jgi:hypothetical protein
VRDDIVRAMGAGRFELTRVGNERMYILQLPEQRLLLWFAPDGTYYELMAVRRAFDKSEQIFASVLAYQRGEEGLVDVSRIVPRPDPRRGFDG